jgi:hypothetical protein
MEDPLQQQNNSQATDKAYADIASLSEAANMPAQSLDQPTVVQPPAQPNGQAPPFASLSSTDDELTAPKQSLWRRLLRYRVVILVTLVILGGILVLLRRSIQPISTVEAGDFNAIQINLADVAPKLASTTGQTLTVNGQLQVASSIVISPTVQPASGTAGQLYFDQNTNQLNYYNGTEFLPVGGNTTFIQNTSNLFGGSSITNIANATAGITTTGGTTDRLLKFTSAQTAGDSIITDKGTHVQVDGGVDIIANSNLTDLNFWPSNPSPALLNAPDGNGPVELGTKFTTDVAGQVNGLRFYKGSSNTGAHTGRLWSSTGSILASVTFGSETASGWQTALFANPVAISPDTTYVISYHTSAGFYSADGAYFGAHGVDNGPLHALASGIDGGNGVFNYGVPGTFPTRTFNSTNYWVDVLFTGSIFDDTSKFRVNGAPLSSGDLSNDSNLAKRGSSQIFSGHNIFRNANDSLDAFSIQKADTTSILSVSTANLRVIIGPGGGDTNGTLLVLGNKNEAGDPSGTEGAIYYNNFQKMFRCYRDGEWSECATNTVDHGFTVYDEFLGGQTNSFTPNDTIGSLGWHATAIGANGAIDFNPATPASVADRPGVLALQTPGVSNQGTTLKLGNDSGDSVILARGNILKTAVAVDNTSNLVLRIGLHNESSTTTQPISGVWWEANPAINPNWRYCYGNGVTPICGNTTNLITANTWVRLSINISGTGAGTSEATFYINGNPQVVTAVTFDSTSTVSPALSFYTTTGATRTCYWDYYQLKGTTSAAR